MIMFKLDHSSRVYQVKNEIITKSNAFNEKENNNLSKDIADVNVNDKSRVENNSKNLDKKSSFVKNFYSNFLGPSVNTRKKILTIFILIIFAFILLTSIVLILIFATIPCSLIKCHVNANTCKNHFFYAECICDFGFNGNGREYCDECSISSSQPNVRIVGGFEAIPHSWPYAALVLATYKTEYVIKKEKVMIDVSFLCGGTLINRKTVLTAAHCIIKDFEYDYKGESYMIKIKPNKFYPTLESMYKVYLGVHNRSILTSKNISPAVTVPVEKIFIHEDFDEENVLNDITILKLKNIVYLKRNIQVACLPNPKWSYNFPTPNTPAWILGWGTTSEGGTTPNELKNARISIYNGSVCSKVVHENKRLWDAVICAGDLEGGKDTCQGDSGGSIFTREMINGKLKYISSGIVSYGDGCGKKNKPG